MSRFAQFAVLALAVAVGLILFKAPAQDSPAGAPSVTAIAKGPDQINLVWPELRGSHYGYLVEIQSDDDPRYTQWSELQPIPKASGYTCDSSIVHQGSPCKTSDPEGVHVYNPATNGVPQWVTDTNYTDPQDDSPAQFISWALRQNTIYRFRVRTYTGQSNIQYGPYSSAAVATTAQAALRYVSPTGNDDNDGTAPDDGHAWRTLSHGAARIACGQELIVMGGDYANDAVTMQQTCSAGGKAVVMVNPGDTATITSMAAANAWHPILLLGSHIVIDGLRVVSATPAGDYDVQIDGSYNALLNLDIHPPVIPSFKGGVNVLGSHNLIYRSALRDYGSPDSLQNPNGDNGFVLVFQGKDATGNVSWSNHLTRGGHDVTLCKAGCRFNRFLNNVMDGGWGMGFENVFGDGLGSDHNLIEGNIIKSAGKLVSFYKPSIEISGGDNTVRRNISYGGAYVAIEESAFGGVAARNLVYNNTFFAPGSCLFQSSAGGSSSYDGNVFANNICYKFKGLASDIYSGNKTNNITRNAIVQANAKGALRPDAAIIVWNHSAGGSYEDSKRLAYADKFYSPPFSRNKGLDVDPAFAGEPAFDFHLAAGSPLIGAGIIIPDVDWGGAEGPVDVGAFGIRIPPLHREAKSLRR